MAKKYQPNIVLIGAGNVAFHLGQALKAKGLNIVQVYSRTASNAKKLAQLLQCESTNNLKKINPDAQLYILAVSDHVIVQLAKKIATQIPEDALVVHTSGATPAQSLKGLFKFYGTFYPLQTFSKSRAVDFTQIPFCIYANRKIHREQLASLAKKLSPAVYFINDQQRAVLHVAAVFANNFTNHLIQVSESILKAEDLPFDLLKPLILETANKIQHNAPKAMQTGPAIRNDQSTIQQHLSYLEKHPDYQKLYLLLTQSIQSS